MGLKWYLCPKKIQKRQEFVGKSENARKMHEIQNQKQIKYTVWDKMRFAEGNSKKRKQTALENGKKSKK